MNGPAPAMRLLGEVDEAASARLRETLRFAQSTFAYYAKLFRRLGISGVDLENEPPLDVLRRLPRLDGHGLDALSNESLRAGFPIIDVETSSGPPARAKGGSSRPKTTGWRRSSWPSCSPYVASPARTARRAWTPIPLH